MTKKKKTYGEVIAEHEEKNLTLEDDIREYTRLMSRAAYTAIWNEINQKKSETYYHHKDFYITLHLIVERVFNKPKFIAIARQSCPTPVYRTSVYKYHHRSGSLEFLWDIPDKIKYYDIVHNPQKYLSHPSKTIQNRAKFVLLMESGELLTWVKKENGEKTDAVIKIQPQSDLIH